MKVIVAGSRSVRDYEIVSAAIVDSGWIVGEVVSGTARGVDRMGERWAREHGVPVKRFPARWGEFGKAAGVIRNADMAVYADALIAVWDGHSPGTQNMIATMRRLGKPLVIVTVSGNEVMSHAGEKRRPGKKETA